MYLKHFDLSIIHVHIYIYIGCFGRFASQWIFYVNLIFLLAGLGAVVYAVLLLTDAELLGMVHTYTMDLTYISISPHANLLTLPLSQLLLYICIYLL